ncbi:MAG: hypothetical protein J6S67_07555 [Methanobrevibacter sp.]|nr:hypothetical protein [Methanobrevibacter sp.]
MENENEVSVPVAKIRLSPEEEHGCYINLRSQLIKLLYMIEAEQRGEGDIGLWFYGFMFELASANSLCNNKLLKVVIKIHGLYDENNYKTMTHAQIKRQIMESKGVLDHLIGDRH